MERPSSGVLVHHLSPWLHLKAISQCPVTSRAIVEGLAAIMQIYGSGAYMFPHLSRII